MTVNFDDDVNLVEKEIVVLSITVKEGDRYVVNHGESLTIVNFDGHVSLAEKEGVGMAERRSDTGHTQQKEWSISCRWIAEQSGELIELGWIAEEEGIDAAEQRQRIQGSRRATEMIEELLVASTRCSVMMLLDISHSDLALSSSRITISPRSRCTAEPRNTQKMGRHASKFPIDRWRASDVACPPSYVEREVSKLWARFHRPRELSPSQLCVGVWVDDDSGTRLYSEPPCEMAPNPRPARRLLSASLVSPNCEGWAQPK
ncbi:hypothetical protein BHM03_00047034 [Ensete ventricosum]|nr:hypothetical protein BHM03_00047034 [Ensete ventricosum]